MESKNNIRNNIRNSNYDIIHRNIINNFDIFSDYFEKNMKMKRGTDMFYHQFLKSIISIIGLNNIQFVKNIKNFIRSFHIKYESVVQNINNIEEKSIKMKYILGNYLKMMSEYVYILNKEYERPLIHKTRTINIELSNNTQEGREVFLLFFNRDILKSNNIRTNKIDDFFKNIELYINKEYYLNNLLNRLIDINIKDFNHTKKRLSIIIKDEIIKLNKLKNHRTQQISEFLNNPIELKVIIDGIRNLSIYIKKLKEEYRKIKEIFNYGINYNLNRQNKYNDIYIINQKINELINTIKNNPELYSEIYSEIYIRNGKINELINTIQNDYENYCFIIDILSFSKINSNLIYLDNINIRNIIFNELSKNMDIHDSLIFEKIINKDLNLDNIADILSSTNNKKIYNTSLEQNIIDYINKKYITDEPIYTDLLDFYLSHFVKHSFNMNDILSRSYFIIKIKDETIEVNYNDIDNEKIFNIDATIQDKQKILKFILDFKKILENNLEVYTFNECISGSYILQERYEFILHYNGHDTEPIYDTYSNRMIIKGMGKFIHIYSHNNKFKKHLDNRIINKNMSAKINILKISLNDSITKESLQFLTRKVESLEDKVEELEKIEKQNIIIKEKTKCNKQCTISGGKYYN